MIASIKYETYTRVSSYTCEVVIPPISGVPVPGANAGSQQSISSVKYTGALPLPAVVPLPVGILSVGVNKRSTISLSICDNC